ncbi:NAD-dependent epimerase/dehydratase family protein [Cohnella sp. JJ-181]|uniref:NAD-dependent epimerase/dehydratase family protein n=1 Tax=Cohnella rhizoplanae TaxID=2974897 RepID=UPI0022FF609A|nr:NAD-dependent epimerase/dehydratase family protein [Cohnella sp. JJ-181]CAI6062165.1 hypothetical protein COHCIP112018_01923 [Cohnella sp. JJ-181]
MNVMIFGATGMVGRSVLRECLISDEVHSVLSIGRQRTGQQHDKLQEAELEDVSDLSSIEPLITGFDACFFCLGVSAVGMNEAEYKKVTYDITLSAAKTLVGLNPRMTFIYVSGSGTDSTEKGRVMWAGIKGKTENDLLRLPFKAAYMFRPGVIIPTHGVKSKTKLYQAIYDLLKPFYPLLMKARSVITSEQLGNAMIKVARDGHAHPILESVDIKKAALSRRDDRIAEG